MKFKFNIGNKKQKRKKFHKNKKFIKNKEIISLIYI